MKALGQKNTSQSLLSEVHLARIRLAKAEGQLAAAKEMARAAKRRRKEARQAARRTKKQTRLAKRELTDAKLAFAQAEAKLARIKQREVRTRVAKKQPAKKKVVAPRSKKSARPVPTFPRKPTASTKSTNAPKKVGESNRRKARVAKSPVVVPRDFASPVTTKSGPADQAIAQVVKSGEEDLVAQVETEAPVAPDASGT